MNKRSIKFAMAVDDNGLFQSKYFGNADKYLIYEWKNNEMAYACDAANPIKSVDEEQEFTLQKKGHAIAELLKSKGVKVLVAKMFGENIHIVKQHFIPVIIYIKKSNETIYIIKRHIKWIEDELNNSPAEYKLFHLKHGLLKMII
jgi:predicted Fe-Mo cluster-binding NifX family protein